MVEYFWFYVVFCMCGALSYKKQEGWHGINLALENPTKEKVPRIIDIHSHVLPGLDDGAKDMDETLAMLRIAAKEGITDMIVTPHFNSGMRSANPKTILQVLRQVRTAAEENHIPIRLYLGNEVYYFSELPNYLNEKRICTMNAGKHVLVEFSPSARFHYIRNAMDSLRGAGYRPILAHVERYNALVEDIENVRHIKAIGVQLQVNVYSVIGKNGSSAKRFVHQILEEGLVDYVGTDAHGSKHRTPQMAKCRDLLLKKYGEAYTTQLLAGNAMRMLQRKNKDKVIKDGDGKQPAK